MAVLSIEKLRRYIDRTQMSKIYPIGLKEAFALAHQAYGSNGLLFEAISLAFEYGQAREYRAAKAAEAKRKQEAKSKRKARQKKANRKQEEKSKRKAI